MCFPSDSVPAEQLACAAWPVSVGKKVAAHTRAVKLVRSTLVVEVEDKQWQRQLFTLRYQILSVLCKNLGSHLVDDLEFRIAARRRGPETAATISRTPDEADGIADPVLRRIYKASRKKALA